MLHISTHSRAKAAGGRQALCGARKHDFNSQPREGGWPVSFSPETPSAISTHSRAKAAGSSASPDFHFSGHFNSQPREGGWLRLFRLPKKRCHFNSQPREGGWIRMPCLLFIVCLFQLTAARRRLAARISCRGHNRKISTHSRAKAAGYPQACAPHHHWHFNSQPREGGWPASFTITNPPSDFNSQPREGGWKQSAITIAGRSNFNSQPREGGWGNDYRFGN